MAVVALKAEVNGQTAFLGGAKALNVLSEAVTGGTPPQSWSRKLQEFLNCSDGGTFDLAGSTIVKNGLYVTAQGIQFRNDEHEGKGPAYWEIAENVSGIAPATLASTIRSVLQSPSTNIRHPWVATLIAAMFLSEVVRNPRSLAINLMLLDLIQKGVKYGSGSDKDLDFNKLLQYQGKTKNYTYGSSGGTNTVTVGKGGQAGTVRGGKLPMSQLGAMNQYQTTLENGYEDKFNKKKFETLQKQAKLNLQPPNTANTAYHFENALLEKECTVALRWLLACFASRPIEHVTGTESRTVTEKGVWGKQDQTVTRNVDVKQPVTLTPLRSHLRDNAWQDCATPGGMGSLTRNIVYSVRQAFQSRYGSLECQIA